MKNSLITIAAAVCILTYSCKSGKTKVDETATTSATTPVASSTEPAPAENKESETKTYTITATPDSASLGKNKEALIKIKNLKAVQLNNPDGANTGTELSYDIEVTNNNKIGGASVYINPNDFRLLLDNGTKITHANYNSVSTDPESTKTSADNKFTLPAGTKPVALNVFFDETSASVKLELK